MKRSVLTLLVVLLLMLASNGVLAQEEFRYEDPSGVFSVVLGDEWQVIELTNTYGQFQLVNSAAVITLMAVPVTDDASNSDEGARAAFRHVGIEIADIIAAAGQGSWDLYIYSTEAGQSVAAAALTTETSTVTLLLNGDESVIDSPPMPVIALLSQIRVTDTHAIELPTTVEAFEVWVADLAARDGVSISIAVSMGTETIYSAGFGMRDADGSIPADGDTVYHWGSSTKIVTTTALMQLVEQGLVDLDAPISDYLDYFPAQFGTTPRLLLTHSSGIPNQPDVLPYISVVANELLDADLVAREYAANLTALDYAPGSEVRYNNYGFLLLGEIVHQVSGMPYPDYVRQNILMPLGMTRTDFIHTPDMLANTAQSSGALVEAHVLQSQLGSTLTDALFLRVDEDRLWLNTFNVLPAWGGLNGPVSEQIRFLSMFVNEGELDGVRILRPETVAQMQTLQVGTDREGFGLGWRLSHMAEHYAIGHGGGGPGIAMEMQIFPQYGVAISVMTNYTGYNASAIIETALNVLLTHMPVN